MLQVPEHQCGFGSGGLEQQREEDIEGAETHAVLAQLRARGLIEGLHLLVDRVAANDTEVLDHAEGDAACEAGYVFSFVDLDEWLQSLADDFGQPGIEALKHAFLVGRGQLLAMTSPRQTISPLRLSLSASVVADATRRARMASSLPST